MSSNNNFKIDRNQIAQQLELLGYAPGEKVFLRAFYPKDDPRKGSKEDGRKAEATSVESIARSAERLQNGGRGIYLVVNGGGDKDVDVKACRAVFFEHDDLDKKLQLTLWRKLGLPEPTFQVDTGGKSIHSYWVFDQPIDPQRWKSLQTDLLEYSDGDRSLKNPSRVMRLAGCYHISVKGAHPTVIVSASGTRYRYEEIRQVVPTPKKATTQPAPLSLTFDNVPLEVCLPVDDRDLILSGVVEPGRNTTGAKLARSIIGASIRLPYLGYAYSGDPRQLFDDYCFRCSPPLDAKEADQVWKSAEGDNPTATLTDDAIVNCVKSWQKKQQATHLRLSSLSTNCKSDGDSDSSGDSWVTATRGSRQTIQEAVTTVTTVLGGRLGTIEEKYALHQAYLNSGIERRVFDEIVATERLKLTQIELDTKEKLKSLVASSQADIDWHKVLPPSLARDLCHDAEVQNVDPVVIWQTILATCASLSGIRTKLDVESHKIPAIIWTATVLETGGGKTRGDSLGLAPLIELQVREKTRHDEALRAYKLALREWEKGGRDGDEPLPPVLRKYLFDVATIQAVMKRCAENGDNGALWARDEINGLFKSLGQFNASGGDEGLQILLKAWNGGAMSCDRVSLADSFFVKDSALSLTGGIQPGVFRESFKDSQDASGLQARFLFAVPTRQRQSRRKSKGYCQLADKLPGLYSWLNELPATTIKLSRKADDLYAELIELQEDELEKTSNPAVRAWLAKWSTHAMRIALILHLIECFYRGLNPDCPLLPETLERAISISDYYRSVFSSLQEQVSDTDELSTLLLQIQDRALKAPQGITMRDLYRSVKSLSKVAKEEGVSVATYAESLCNQLSSLGYGEIIRTDRKVKYIALASKNNKGGSNIGDNGDSSHQTIMDNQLQLSPEVSPQLSLSPQNCNYHVNTEAIPPDNDTLLPPGEVEANAGFIRDAIAEMNWTMIQELTDGWEPQFKRLVWRCLTTEEKATVKLLAER